MDGGAPQGTLAVGEAEAEDAQHRACDLVVGVRAFDVGQLRRSPTARCAALVVRAGRAAA